MKAVYVVLEPQYQNALTSAATAINQGSGGLAIELSGYLIEELRDEDNYAGFCADVAAADVFIASLIFIEDLAQKVVDAVAPHRDRLRAAVVFPSMPEVMRLNKLGSFSMAQLGQSKSAIAQFMKKRKEANGAGFQDAMLKLLNTLPTVSQVPACGEGPGRPQLHAQLPVLARRNAGQPAQLPADAGGQVRLSLRSEAGASRAMDGGRAGEVFPDLGIWHPLAPGMFEDLKEYLNWTASRTDLSERSRRGPVIGLVLQRSHIVTGDEAHYVAVIQELEFRGATRDSDLLRRPGFQQAGQRLLLRPAQPGAAPGGRRRQPDRLRPGGWPRPPGSPQGRSRP